MPVSMREIATTAGVSETTVSIVLNNKKGIRVGLETQRRVRQIAKDLNYRPNSFARSMARRRTNTLRLVTASHDNPFFVAVAKAVGRYTRPTGYRLTLEPWLGEDTRKPGEDDGIWPVDGALIWADEAQWLKEYLGWQEDEVPVVYMGFQGSHEVDAVTSDLYAGGRLAAEHLVERGYKKIAYFWPEFEHLDPGRDLRIKAYEDVCREAGLPTMHLHIPVPKQWGSLECMPSLTAAMEIAARPASERPDAIMCLNDMLALGVYHGLRRGGLRIPEDVAVVGFDGTFPALCLDQPMTTVAIPVDAICENAVDLLIRRINGDTSIPPNRRITFPAELLVGGTT